MPMSDAVRAKIKALNYNGSDEEMYESLKNSFANGFWTAPDLIDGVLEKLDTETYEMVIQCLWCDSMFQDNRRPEY